MDFKFGGTDGATSRLDFSTIDSLYGGGRVGQEITGGVNLDGEQGTAGGQFYNLTNGYSSPTGSENLVATEITLEASGTVTDGGVAVLGAGDPADATT